MKAYLVMTFWNLKFTNWIIFILSSKFRIRYIEVVLIASRCLFLYFFDNYTPVSAYTVFVFRYALPPINVRSRFYQYNAITPSYDRWNSFDKWCDLQCMHLKLASRFVSNSLGCSLTHSVVSLPLKVHPRTFGASTYWNDTFIRSCVSFILSLPVCTVFGPPMLFFTNSLTGLLPFCG